MTWCHHTASFSAPGLVNELTLPRSYMSFINSGSSSTLRSFPISYLKFTNQTQHIPKQWEVQGGVFLFCFSCWKDHIWGLSNLQMYRLSNHHKKREASTQAVMSVWCLCPQQSTVGNNYEVEGTAAVHPPWTISSLSTAESKGFLDSALGKFNQAQ